MIFFLKRSWRHFLTESALKMGNIWVLPRFHFSRSPKVNQRSNFEFWENGQFCPDLTGIWFIWSFFGHLRYINDFSQCLEFIAMIYPSFKVGLFAVVEIHASLHPKNKMAEIVQSKSTKNQKLASDTSHCDWMDLNNNG